MKGKIAAFYQSHRRAVRAAAAMAVAAVLTVAVYLGSALTDLPDVESLRQYKPSVTTTLWTADGVLMAELFKENRVIVDIRELPAPVIHAFLAAEDSDFYAHGGLDFMGIVRAAFANLRRARVSQGGSTITQQVAKSLLLTPERSLRRKIREAVLALRIEKNLTKEEILNLYLNHIYMGHGAYGIGAAALAYFGVPARELTLEQASLLAGLPQAPSRYDPYKNPDEARTRRAYVLRRMEEEGWADPARAEAARAAPLGLLARENPFLSVAPYFSEHIRRELDRRFGTEDALMGGYRVTATVDSQLQSAAQRALEEGLEKLDMNKGYRGPLRRVSSTSDEARFQTPPEPVAHRTAEAWVTGVGDWGIEVVAGGEEFIIPIDRLAWALPGFKRPKDVFAEDDVVLCRFDPGPDGSLMASVVQPPAVEGALVCLDAQTGEVLAMVGGYSFARSEFNRAVQAKRQAGSAIKPLLYAAALSKGFTPATLVYDSPIVYESAALDEKWKPKNYTDKFYGATTLREALVFSRNVVTIKILQDMGVGYAMRYLQGLGMTSALNADLSLALGSPSVSPLEMASIYSVFATGGYRREPVFLSSILDRDGREVEARAGPAAPPREVMDPRVAFALTQMMQDVIREGTGTRARGLPVPAAGKTGTTNESRDAWFVGFTPGLVCAVWVGYDDGATLGERETGGGLAAPIWRDFMGEALTRRDGGRDFPMPLGIEFARVDADTGTLATPRSRRTFQAVFLEGTVPDEAGAVPGTAPDRPGAPGGPPALDARDPDAMEALR